MQVSGSCSLRQAGSIRLSMMLVAVVAAVAVLATGCVFRDVRLQQARIDAQCQIQGTVASERGDTRPLVVALVRVADTGANGVAQREIADHFVLEGAGRWAFLASPGTYGLAAFQDSNADLVYQPGEPLLRVDPGSLITCRAGEHKTDIALRVPADGRARLQDSIDIARLQVRSVSSQLSVSLGAVTAAGEVVALDDARFSKERASDGLWRPFDFLFVARPGVYFLEPYASHKTPVLFVHGIGGSPTDFRYLIEHLDRSRFQPWVYYYPSGAHLGAVADHLDQTVKRLQLQHGFQRLLLVAHSMGGLVSRGFLLRNQTDSRRIDIPLFVSISTPWGGVPFAAEGVKRAPTAVRVWFDISPGSAYLRDIFYADPDRQARHRPLPPGTTHHLLFGFQRDSRSFGESDDRSVSVASQLYPGAQQDARRLYGFDATHEGILETAEVSALVNRLLAEPARLVGR